MRRSLSLSSAACALAAVVARAHDSVERGREALGSRWHYPWYDDANDAIRQVPVKSASQPWKWNWGGGGGLGSFDLATVFFWLVLAIVLGLLIYVLIVAFLRRERRRAASTVNMPSLANANEGAKIEALPFKVRRGQHDLLTEAERLYRAGRFDEAVVYLFSYELIELDRQQLVHLAKGKTNRQYLRELGRQRTLRDLLEQTMVAFEDVFFGNHPLDQFRFEACWARVGEFQRLTGREAS